jgi:beta-lactamase regulating signal transducer with metallopeptidase domain
MSIWSYSDITNSWLQAFAAQSLYAAITALLVWAALKLWRPKHPVWHVALWSLVLIRFIMPVDLASPWTARTLVEQTSADWIMRDYSVVQSQQRPLFDAEKSAVVPGGDASAAITPDNDLQQAQPANKPINWVLLTFCVWLLGASLLLTRLVIAYYRLMHLLSRATPITSEPLTRMVDQWRVNLGVRRPVALLSSTECTGAFTCRLFKPVIVLPAPLVPRMDDADLSAILGHEMAHIRGLDSLWLLIEQVLRALFFFHPAIWIATSKLDEAREALRDLDMLKAGSVSANSYAVTLLSVLKSQNENARTPLLAVAMGKTAQRLKDRLMLLKVARVIKYPSRWLIAASTLAVAALILPMAQSVAKKPKEAAQQKQQAISVTPTAEARIAEDNKTDAWPAVDADIAAEIQDAEHQAMALSDADMTPPTPLVAAVAPVSPVASVAPVAPLAPLVSEDMAEALADLAELEHDARQEVVEAEQAVTEARAELRSADAEDLETANENLRDAVRELAQVRQRSAEAQREAAIARRDLQRDFQREVEHAQRDAAQAMRDAEQARQDAAQAMRDAEQARRDAEQAQREAEREWRAAYAQANKASYYFFSRDADTSTMVVIDKNEVRCGANVKAGTAHKIIVNGRHMTCTGSLTRADMKGGFSDTQKAVGILGQKGVISVQVRNGKTTSVHVRSSSDGSQPSAVPAPPAPPASGSGGSAMVKRIKAESNDSDCDDSIKVKTVRADFAPVHVHITETVAAALSGRIKLSSHAMIEAIPVNNKG